MNTMAVKVLKDWGQYNKDRYNKLRNGFNSKKSGMMSIT